MNPRGPAPMFLRRSIMLEASGYGLRLCAGTGERFTVASAHCLATGRAFPLPTSDASLVIVCNRRAYMVLEWPTICNLLTTAGRLPTKLQRGVAGAGDWSIDNLAKTARNHGLCVSLEDGELRIGSLKALVVESNASLPEGVDILVARPVRTTYGLLDYVVGCKLLAIAGVGTRPHHHPAPRYVMWRDRAGNWLYMSRESYRTTYGERDEDDRPAIEWLEDTEEACILAAARLHGRPRSTEGTDIEPETEPAKGRKCPTCKAKFRSINGARYCPACVRAAQAIHEESVDWQWPSLPGGVYR